MDFRRRNLLSASAYSDSGAIDENVFYLDHSTTLDQALLLKDLVLTYGEPYNNDPDNPDYEKYDEENYFTTTYINYNTSGIKVYYKPSKLNNYYLANNGFTSHEGSFSNPILLGLEDFTSLGEGTYIYFANIDNPEDYCVHEGLDVVTETFTPGPYRFEITYVDTMTWAEWCNSECNTLGWEIRKPNTHSKECVCLDNSSDGSYVPAWEPDMYIYESPHSPSSGSGGGLEFG